MFIKVTGIQQFDFQINRVLTYGVLAGNQEEIINETKNIKTLSQWSLAWKKLGELAEKRDAYIQSAYAYRMAEFFLKETNEEKDLLYLKSMNYFYRGFDELGIDYQKRSIEYKNTIMHTLYMKAKKEKGILLVCGGYDSFIEEFVLTVREFVENGYSVILFEGDGQGQTRKNGLPFIHNWEQPTKAILDFYEVKKCMMLGISWGGYLAIRAAAYESRIHKVIAYDVLDNGLEVMTNVFPVFLRRILSQLFKKNQKATLNFLMSLVRKRSIIADWGMMQGMYITQTKTVFDFYKELAKHSLSQEICDNLKNDVLLLAGEKDHYIPTKQYYRLKSNIHNAAKLKSRMFTVKEGGEQHCQIGNHQLAVDEILHFLG